MGQGSQQSRTFLKLVAIAAALLLTSGSILLGTSLSAYAAATLTASPATGLSNGTVVTVTGSGFTANGTGNILECNNSPGEPTVALTLPVVGLSNKLVGCTSPSISRLVSTNTTGRSRPPIPSSKAPQGHPVGRPRMS